MTTAEFIPGMLVYYRANNQHGFVTSKNDTFVFVRYMIGNSLNTQSAATNPEDLEIVWCNDNTLSNIVSGWNLYIKPQI